MRGILLTTLALLTVALAGCSDDGGGGGDDTMTSSSTTSSSGTSSSGTSTTTSTSTTSPPSDPEPITISGSTDGLVDCQLISQGQAPLLGDTQSVPAEASGRSYSVSIEPGDVPLPASVCLTWDGASAGLTGTVPDGASQVGVYADGAPAGVGYTITIE